MNDVIRRRWRARRGVTSGGGVVLLAGLWLAGCADQNVGASTPTGPSAPAPSFYFGDQFTGTRTAVRVVVDAGTTWLLDDQGDFVFGADPGANWNAQTGLALSWAQVAGAVRYNVLASDASAPSAWVKLLSVDAPDPKLSPTVVAHGVNPWTGGLGTSGYPWSFGNHVRFAIASENKEGMAFDTSAALETADEFPGMLTGIAIDDAALPVPFKPTTERGATFDKTVRVSFSEPMSTAAAPVLTPQSANVTVRKINAIGWGAESTTPDPTPLSAASHAFVSLWLTVKGACSELLVARSAGDLLLDVRDTSFYETGATRRLLFLDGGTGAFLAEAAGVSAVDPSLGRLTLGAPLSAGLPAGSLVCALSGPGATLTQLVSSAGTGVTVMDASPFFVGEPVLVYEPQANGASGVADLRVVAGVDTAVNGLNVSAPLSPGHTSASLVIPLNGLGGEVTLRPSAQLALQRDATGGPGTELFVGQPTGVMVGDTLLVDADGDLDTTADQAQAVVKQVRFAVGAGAYTVVVDLPASLTLLHGRAAAIGLGDCFRVGGTHDTSSAGATPLDGHRDQFTPDGLLF